MPREPIITAGDLPEPDPERSEMHFGDPAAKPREEDTALRPRHMNEMVGQHKVAERLED